MHKQSWNVSDRIKLVDSRDLTRDITKSSVTKWGGVQHLKYEATQFFVWILIDNIEN